MSKSLRYSRQRDRIYQYLTISEEHPSAEMIYTALRKEMPELSLGTVYRNLKLLEELGMVRKVTNLRGNDRYDAVCGDHIHFLCESCGAIADLPVEEPGEVLKNLPGVEGYRFSKLDMMITGRCPNCTASN